jgi:ATP-dependent Clp protease ATP-binding subunit ClpB
VRRKNKLSNAQKLKSELEGLRLELDEAKRRGEFQRPANWPMAGFPDWRRGSPISSP